MAGPRVHRALRQQGIRVGKKRIERLMRHQGLVARSKRRFRWTTDSNHGSAIAANRLARDFAAEGPNQAWVGDVTYIATGEGWLYLAVLVDLLSRRVVGWARRETNDTGLALNALEKALTRRGTLAKGLLHHTDRASPYASEAYRRRLASRGLVASMSRKGDCWDNAVAERFFATLRAELVDAERYVTHQQAERSVGDYIENLYNAERLNSYLDYVSPIEFELRADFTSRMT